MKNRRWTERSKAFAAAAELLGSNKSTADDVERLRLGVIQLLVMENNDRTPVANDSEGEENGEYHASLIGFVAGLNDERAIPALLGAVNTGGIACRGVARFGKKALDPTLLQVKGQDSEMATGALFVIRDMLELHTVSDAESRLRIKAAVRSALASPDGGVRDSAIVVSEYLDDREEFVPVLKEIAEHDPEKLPNQPKNDGTVGDYYIVREHAAKLLRKIANHEPPAIDRGVTR